MATQMTGTFLKCQINDTGQFTPTYDVGVEGIFYRPTTLLAFTQMLVNTIYGSEGWILDVTTASLGNMPITNCGFGSFGDPVQLQLASVVIVNNDSGTLLSNTFTMNIERVDDFAVHISDVIQVIQTVSFNLTDLQIKVDVSFVNKTAETMTDITYLRTANPMQALNTGGFGTRNAIGTNMFPSGIAVRSCIDSLSDTDSAQRLMALASDRSLTKVSSYGDALYNTIANIAAGGYARLNADSTITTVAPAFAWSGGTITGINLWYDTITSLPAGETRVLEPFYYDFDLTDAPEPEPEPASPTILRLKRC